MMANIFFAVLFVGAVPSIHSNPLNEAAEVEPLFALSMEEPQPPVGINETGLHLDNIDERGPYVGGDMVLSPEQLEDYKSGVLASTLRWPKGNIPYVLDNSFTTYERSTIEAGMNLIQSTTCIKFSPRTSELAYIYIRRGGSSTGCYSDVGMQTSRVNVLNLQYDGCMYSGIIAHELIHAIGYYHEQSRPDRDDYVTINWSNIEAGRAYNFDKYSRDVVGTFGVPYDYDSIMHYSAYAFASRYSIPTISPKSTSVPANRLGQRSKLSTLDAKKINAMYASVC